MDRHLRMDQHLDRVTLKTEQPGCLDHLKPLVHHRRAVDRNLLPHAPIRMFDRLRRSDCWKIGQRHGAKRSARRGQTYMADFLQSVTCWHSKLGMVRLPPGPALKNGVMFTVEWQNSRTVFAGGLHHDTACRYQRFLIGERQRLARFDRRHHRAKTSKAGDPGNHDINRNARQRVTVALSADKLNP